MVVVQVVPVINKLHPTDLEDLFDQNQLIDISSENLADSEKLSFEILRALKSKNYIESISLCEKLYSLSDDKMNRLIALQWAVAASEAIYDMNIREKWLKRWNWISNWTHDYWAQFLYHFQFGLTFFFQGHLDEAELHFKECLSLSIHNNYDRGIIRSYHHLGLVARDRRCLNIARDFLTLALQKAKETQRLRMLKRIEDELHSLNISSNYHSNSQKLVSYLKENKFKEARKFLRNIQKLRKMENRKPDAESEYALLSIYLFAVNKQKSLSIVNHRLNDPVVKLKTLELFMQIRKLTPEMEFEYLLLSKKYNVSKKEGSLAQISSYNKLSHEAQRLLSLLENNPHGLNKEQIAISLWKQSYDPLYHDPKIYKLILSCRQEPSIKSKLKNNYGTYLISH